MYVFIPRTPTTCTQHTRLRTRTCRTATWHARHVSVVCTCADVGMSQPPATTMRNCARKRTVHSADQRDAGRVSNQQHMNAPLARYCRRRSFQVAMSLKLRPIITRSAPQVVVVSVIGTQHTTSLCCDGGALASPPSLEEGRKGAPTCGRWCSNHH